MSWFRVTRMPLKIPLARRSVGDVPLEKNVISKTSVFRHENTKKLAQLVKFTYIAAVEII